ncbi:hypothetical protein MPH_13055 [Macrophomina phaseolina MS6]|uniref:Uncharacterized protein n=1 Tax=Macrophomina phaseolina (strain MS6) TaxID=1126212 RepID=K2R6K5_MACPH|nr:hypothetical protein MPH_13055 [Macrophomina phaseolina MS6]
MSWSIDTRSVVTVGKEFQSNHPRNTTPSIASVLHDCSNCAVTMSEFHSHNLATAPPEVPFGYREWTAPFVLLMVLCCWFTASVLVNVHLRKQYPFFPGMKTDAEDSALQDGHQ